MTEIRTAIPEEVDRYLDSLVRTGAFGSKAELVRAALMAYSETAGPLARGFDRENMLAPDGRVYQLEYAREAALRGGPCLGIAYDVGVLLAGATAPRSRLVRSVPKIQRVGQRAAILTSGLLADGYVAVSQVRRAKPRTTEELLDLLVRFYWEHTVDRTKRALAAALLVGVAFGGKPRLFLIDPSGALVEHDAAVMGEGSLARTEVLEARYKRTSAKEAERLALEVLDNPKACEIVHVRA